MNYAKMRKKELIELVKDLQSVREDEYSEPLRFQNLKLKDMLLLLEHSRDLYSTLYDYSHVGTVTFDEKGVIKNINITLADMLGVDRKIVSGTPFLVYIAKEYMQEYLNYLKKVISSKESLPIEFKLRCTNDYRYVQMQTNKIIDYETGDPLFQNTIIDISAKKKIENFLAESESRFLTMADSAPVLIWMIDTDRKCSYVNKEWLTFTGKSLNLELGYCLFTTTHPEDSYKWRTEFDSAFDGKRKFKISCRFLNANGEYRWLLITGVPRFAENEFLGYIGSGIDITEQMNFEKDQEKTIKEKIAMIKEIHHRVKNNLQIISSLLGLQSSNCHNAEVNDALIISSNRVKTMALIHENLYRSHDLSEIQFDIYLNDILFNIFNSYRVDQKDIRLKTDIAHEIMDADTAIHVGLLANELVTNALKYAFKNKVEGEIFVSFKRINGINYQLVISDNGIGLPEGFNIKSSNSLGLMLVNGFIDQLNGKLTIEQDKGTTFIISF